MECVLITYSVRGIQPETPQQRARIRPQVWDINFPLEISISVPYADLA